MRVSNWNKTNRANWDRLSASDQERVKAFAIEYDKPVTAVMNHFYRLGIIAPERFFKD